MRKAIYPKQLIIKWANFFCFVFLNHNDLFMSQWMWCGAVKQLEPHRCLTQRKEACGMCLCMKQECSTLAWITPRHHGWTPVKREGLSQTCSCACFHLCGVQKALGYMTGEACTHVQINNKFRKGGGDDIMRWKNRPYNFGIEQLWCYLSCSPTVCIIIIILHLILVPFRWRLIQLFTSNKSAVSSSVNLYTT